MADMCRFLADQIARGIDGEPRVRVPRALLHRLARYLEAASGLVEDGLVGYDADPDETRGLPAAFRSDGDLWVNEYTIRYDGENLRKVAGIMEFRNGKVVRERLYITEPWEPPAWRAQWVERFVTDEGLGVDP